MLNRLETISVLDVEIPTPGIHSEGRIDLFG